MSPRAFPSRSLCRLARLAACLLLAGAMPLPATAGPDGITVFAAASAKNALDEIADRYEGGTGRPVTVSYAGSSVLARQIQHGAPADVFLSANPDWMDVLERDGLLAPGTRFDLLGNSIVLIAHGRNAAPLEIRPGMDLAGRLGEGRLAVALVDAVPAGIYARAALETLGIWDAVAPRVAQADNVRAALALVSTGEAPMGIVYATDARADDRVSVIGRFPPGSHPPIVYPVAALTAAGQRPGREFLAYLRGEAARKAFERQGFTVLAD